MAIFKALTFDGVNSLDYGIYITGEAAYNAPERAVEMVNIPGKNGALALDQGRFENIEVTYHAGCFADNQADFADKVMKFRNALASRYTYKRLTDEYHPDEYRLGLYKSGLDVDAVRYGTAGEFDIVFDCKPQRFLVDGDRAISPTEWSNVQTESGELVTIDSDGSLAVKSLEVSLSPIQDLNGYDKPWAGGAGKNKAELVNSVNSYTEHGITWTVKDANTIHVQGTSTDSSYCVLATSWTKVFHAQSLAVGTYRASIDNGSVLGRLGKGAGSSFGISGINNGYTFSVTEADEYWIGLYVVSGVTIDADVHVQIESGSTTTNWTPYSNICPISGRTEVVTQRTGKNLLDARYKTTTSQNNVRYYRIGGGGIKLYAGVTYTLSVSEDNTRPSGVYFNEYGPDVSARETYARAYSSYSVTYMPTKDVVIETDCFYSTAPPEGIENIDVQLEVGNTATDYEPYNGNTYTTALGRTVYGGTLDVVSGVLTVTHAMVDLGTLAWGYNSNIPWFYSWTDASSRKPNPSSEVANIWSSDYKAYSRDVLISTDIAGICIDASGNVVIRDSRYTDATAFKTAMSGVQLCYELATPQTYQLTPQQIDLLLGTNHLWSDGEITVEYGVHPYYNPTPFDAKPLIKVTGRGTLGIGEYILTITGSASQTLYIDCETMEIYTLEGTVPTGASSRVSINKNDFPVLESGTNYISVGSGITAVTITPRWWRI